MAARARPAALEGRGGGVSVGDLYLELSRLEYAAAAGVAEGRGIDVVERLEVVLAASDAETSAAGEVVSFCSAIRPAAEQALEHLRAVAGATGLNGAANTVAVAAAKRVSKWTGVVEDVCSRDVATESEVAAGEACRDMLLAALRLERDAGAWQHKGWRRLGLNHKAYFLRSLAKKYLHKFDASMGLFDSSRKLLIQATVPAGAGGAVDASRLLEAGVVTNLPTKKAADAEGAGDDLARAENALRTQRAALGPEHPDVAQALCNVGGACKRLGRCDEALAAYKEALRIQRAALGDEHPSVAQTRISMGIAYRIQRRYDQALKVYEETLRTQRAALGADHQDVAQTRNGMGVVFDRQGSYSKGLEAFRDALRIWRATLGDSHPDTSVARANMGDMLGRLGRHEEALEACDEAMRAYRAAGLSDDHPYVADALKTIARVRAAHPSSSE